MNVKFTAVDGDEMLKVMQQYGTGLLSRRTAIEAIGFVVDVDEELRRITDEEDRKRVVHG